MNRKFNKLDNINNLRFLNKNFTKNLSIIII